MENCLGPGVAEAHPSDYPQDCDLCTNVNCTIIFAPIPAEIAEILHAPLPSTWYIVAPTRLTLHSCTLSFNLAGWYLPTASLPTRHSSLRYM